MNLCTILFPVAVIPANGERNDLQYKNTRRKVVISYQKQVAGVFASALNRTRMRPNSWSS
jgi:hypothetical protein